MPLYHTKAIFAALLVALLCPVATSAQGACQDPEYREFDFWIGESDLTNLRLQDDGSWAGVGTATSRVFPVAGGCGIVELWDGYLGDNHIRGFSVRTYNSDTETWQLLLNWPQENQASFSSRDGVFTHGRGDFTSTFTAPDGATGMTRYTFSDIGHDAFRWNDGTSMDGGQTWRTSWITEFNRRPPMANPLFNVPMFGTDERPRCTEDVYTAANFLIGSWESTNEVGQKYRVEGTPIVAGCAIMEFIKGDNGTDAFTVIGYETAAQRWTMAHLDGGNGESLTRVAGGTAIPFIRR